MRSPLPVPSFRKPSKKRDYAEMRPPGWIPPWALAERLDERGITTAELAARLGKRPSSVRRWRAISGVPPRSATAVVHVLGPFDAQVPPPPDEELPLIAPRTQRECPCDRCILRSLCGAQELACRVFVAWLNGRAYPTSPSYKGSIHPKQPTKTLYKRAQRDVSWGDKTRRVGAKS